MIDQSISEKDDLAEFADYLAEFDLTINFDNETCPVCGVNISDSLSVKNSPFVEYKIVDENSELLLISKELKSKGIPFKVNKKLNVKIIESIEYVFVVLVPLNFLAKLQNEKSI